MMTEEQVGEIKQLVEQLKIVLGEDNDARKGAEQVLVSTKEGAPDKYAVYLTAIIQDQEAPPAIKSLAAVLLRRNVNSPMDTALPDGTKRTLWAALDANSKSYLQTTLLAAI